MTGELIGVVDIGKTNAKLILVEAGTGDVVWGVERRCGTIERSPMRELDVAGIEGWLLSGLASAPGKERIRALVPVAHGAAAVLVSSSGDPLVAPDYEDPVFETVREHYRALRDPFAATFSPFLPLGLNLGRQLYYLQQQRPEVLRSAVAILPYPQYWAWRLCSVMASEVTSLGCHSDLWQPREARFSALATTQGWNALIPPLRRAGDVLGTITPSIARITGLDPSCRVLCGIHDSNASYLCHRIGRPLDEPFAVVSSGTWTVIMANGADLTALREERDMLANVDAQGSPVATARFMGGREYEAIAGNGWAAQHLTPDSLDSILEKRAFALPSFASAGGPFAGRAGTLVNAEKLEARERSALATLYSALQTDLLLDLLGASGSVIVDGPFATNPLYGVLLAALRSPSRTFLGDNRAGPAQCARHLCGHTVTPSLREAIPLKLPTLAGYRSEWRRLISL
jgi:sugar (pentulose or hexulose) kinase